MMRAFNGFVIVPPVNQWDNKDVVIPEISYKTFGKTETEAWLRHCGITGNNLDSSAIIQSWFNKGYRVKHATLTIHCEQE